MVNNFIETPVLLKYNFLPCNSSLIRVCVLNNKMNTEVAVSDLQTFSPGFCCQATCSPNLYTDCLHCFRLNLYFNG